MASYAAVMHREIDRVIDHPTTRTIVAEEPGEVDHEGRPFLYGFISARVGRPYVYYVYVKNAYRRARERHGLALGYASQLFAAAGIDPRKPFGFACHTAYCAKLGRKIPLAELNPLPARYLA